MEVVKLFTIFRLETWNSTSICILIVCGKYLKTSLFSFQGVDITQYLKGYMGLVIK